MFIRIEGPPLKEFQPNKYAKEWVNRRSADCKEGPCRKEKKSTETKSFWKLFQNNQNTLISTIVLNKYVILKIIIHCLCCYLSICTPVISSFQNIFF